jgi:hypothetical protein
MCLLPHPKGGGGMKKIDIYLSHEELCEILHVTSEHSLSDVEAIYRPDAEMWMLTAKLDDTENEVTP